MQELVTFTSNKAQKICCCYEMSESLFPNRKFEGSFFKLHPQLPSTSTKPAGLYAATLTSTSIIN